jgi:DNA-directed RNA polymerase subunit RPC12/RpoP
MLICINCRKEMKCHKNGVHADYGQGHTYPGDVFVCTVCNYKILKTNNESVPDPEYKYSDEYLVMTQ